MTQLITLKLFNYNYQFLSSTLEFWLEDINSHELNIVNEFQLDTFVNCCESISSHLWSIWLSLLRESSYSSTVSHRIIILHLSLREYSFSISSLTEVFSFKQSVFSQIAHSQTHLSCSKVIQSFKLTQLALWWELIVTHKSSSLSINLNICEWHNYQQSLSTLTFLTSSGRVL